MTTEVIKGSFPNVGFITAGTKNIIVLPVNTQGLLELTPMYRRFKYHFKNTARAYEADCFFNNEPVGSAPWYEENGYIIFLLFYKQYEVGNKQNLEETKLSANFLTALNKMIKTVEDKWLHHEDKLNIYSPMIPFAGPKSRIETSALRAKWHFVQEGVL